MRIVINNLKRRYNLSIRKNKNTADYKNKDYKEKLKNNNFQKLIVQLQWMLFFKLIIGKI